MRTKSEESVLRILADTNCRKDYFGYAQGEYLNLVFLCGKARSPADNREQISKQLIEIVPFRYSLYSEDVFDAFPRDSLDLLTLEEIFANISSKIVLIVESYGSACELGAFSFVDNGIGKLLAITNKDYKDDESFLNQGPLKKIKTKAGPDNVLYEEFKGGNIIFSQKLMDCITTIKRSSFAARPFIAAKDGSCYEIHDFGCLVCLLYEYVIRFGCIRKDFVLDAVNALIMNFAALPLSISLDTRNVFSEEQVKQVILSLPDMLVKMGLLETAKNKGQEYYRVNYSNHIKRGADFELLTSVIFNQRMAKQRTIRKECAKAKNLAIKDGYSPWKKA